LTHDSRLMAEDKVSRFVCGTLVKSKGKQPYDAWDDGVRLVELLHSVAVHFSYSNRLALLHAIIEEHGLDCARVKPQVAF